MTGRIEGEIRSNKHRRRGHCRGLQVGWHKFVHAQNFQIQITHLFKKVCTCADFRHKFVPTNIPANLCTWKVLCLWGEWWFWICGGGGGGGGGGTLFLVLQLVSKGTNKLLHSTSEINSTYIHTCKCKLYCCRQTVTLTWRSQAACALSKH